MSENIITLKDIVVEFDGERILDKINLEIKDKEFVTFLGPSGCGKTTTLRIIGGFLEPDSGDVMFDGQRINGVPPYKRNINTVFQRYALFPHLNVYDNIAFGLRIKKMPEKAISKRVAEMLKLVNLVGYEKRSITRLSGGQQQRVAIARALVKRPRVLLLDEPLSNLDARLRLQTREEIRRIQKETQITTIFVTHDQEEAMSISDMIVVMKDGVVHQIGKPQDVYDDPKNLFVAKFLGTPPINVFEGTVRDGRLFIGGEDVLAVKGVKDQEVYIGIRPEGFVLREDGPLSCRLSGVEVMGRDISVVSHHDACQNAAIRSIVSTDRHIDVGGDTVQFALLQNKVFLFDKRTEERILFEA